MEPSVIHSEDVKTAILPVAANGIEPSCPQWVSIFRLPFYRTSTQPLFNYFKRILAQVTNPPIDAIREEIVTNATGVLISVRTATLLIEEKPDNCRMLQIHSPILTSAAPS